MTDEHATIGAPTPTGWDAVTDAGQRRRVPRSVLGAGLRHLRAGQRVRLTLDGDAVVAVALP